MNWSTHLLLLAVPALASPEAEPLPSPILGLPGRPIPEKPAAEPARRASEPRPDPAQHALARLNQPGRNALVDLELPTSEGIQTVRPKEEIPESDIDTRIEQIKASESIRQARDLQKLGRESEAIRLLEATLDATSSPNAQVELHHQLGIIFYQAGDHENAATHLEKVQAMRPDDYKVASNLAAILMSIGEVDRAFVSLEKIDTKQLVRENRKELLFKVHFNYACGYSLRKQSEEAMAHLELASRFSPRDVLSSIGDPNLDHIRKESRFVQLRKELEDVVRLERDPALEK